MIQTISEAVAWRRHEQARPRRQAEIDPNPSACYVGHYQLESGCIVAVTCSHSRMFISKNDGRLRNGKERENGSA